MTKLNVRSPAIYTHEGGKAKHINPEQQLRRSIMACLLWESQFYENGTAIADRISELVPKVAADKVAAMAVVARDRMKLRHAPLLLCREMARHKSHRAFVSQTLAHIVQRADELSEFLAIYWKDGKQPLSAQVKKGLAAAFPKFDAYELAKYNRDSAIKFRDVLFLCHAKPQDNAQDKLWKQLIADELPTPDTWEVALSSATDKKAAWERLLTENKIGGLALLRNLRNMAQAQVDDALIIEALSKMKVTRLLPFRFIAAARYAPQLEPQIERAMMRALTLAEKLNGKTLLLIDVSGSMASPLSAKSDMTRMDAACGLAILAREILDCRVFTFSNTLVEVPARRGFALRDVIVNSQLHKATYLGQALEGLAQIPHERLIVVTDEQAHDNVSDPTANGYIVNVASYQNGVGYSAWRHIDGWSEAVLDYIREVETLDNG